MRPDTLRNRTRPVAIKFAKQIDLETIEEDSFCMDEVNGSTHVDSDFKLSPAGSDYDVSFLDLRKQAETHRYNLRSKGQKPNSKTTQPVLNAKALNQMNAINRVAKTCKFAAPLVGQVRQAPGQKSCIVKVGRSKLESDSSEGLS